MAIPHVAAGGQCDPDAQNTLIDKVNTDQGRIDTLETDVDALETEVDGKAAVCSEAGQDVAATGAAGSAATAARCDHEHKGVSKLVAGTNITLDPTSGVGEVEVSAAGGGVTILSKTFSIPAQTYSPGDNVIASWDHMPTAILGTSATVTGHSDGPYYCAANPVLSSTPSEGVYIALGTLNFNPGADQTGAYPVPALDSNQGHIGDTGFNVILSVYYYDMIVASGSVTVYYVD